MAADSRSQERLIIRCLLQIGVIHWNGSLDILSVLNKALDLHLLFGVLESDTAC